MASSEQIAVDKSYFYALLRRADFHTSSNEADVIDVSDKVSISKAEYDDLLRISRQLEALKKALYQGGVTPETIDTLISGADRYDQRTFHDSACQMHLQDCGALPVSHRRHLSSSAHSQLQVPRLQRQSSYGVSGTCPSLLDDDEFHDFDVAESLVDNPGNAYSCGSAAPNNLQNGASRTIYFASLPDSTSFQDVQSVVRGGKLVSLNMPSERSATISFLDPDAASRYLTWAKKNDIYIHQKRVEVRWAERQFVINNHIANKIHNGATRNLMISGAFERGLTEAQIREDMDHIHGLAIIQVSFRNGDAYVSTNSIHNALFARTCMLSRTAYKGCRIHFAPDECDISLPERPRQPKTSALESLKRPNKRSQNAAVNRFHLLNTEDGTESDSDDGIAMPGDNHSECSSSQVASQYGE